MDQAANTKIFHETTERFVFRFPLIHSKMEEAINFKVKCVWNIGMSLSIGSKYSHFPSSYIQGPGTGAGPIYVDGAAWAIPMSPFPLPSVDLSPLRADYRGADTVIPSAAARTAGAI